jgi:hypothetical protein
MTCRIEIEGLNDTHFEGNCQSHKKTVKGPLDKTVYVLVVHNLRVALRALAHSNTIIGNAVNAFTTLVVWRFVK